MSTHAGPNIVEDGLVLYLDAANENSYPGSGTTWYDLSGNGNDGTLVNGVGYDGGNQGNMSFDGSNDYISINNLGYSNHTIDVWFNSNDGTQGGASFATICSIVGNYDGGSSKYSCIALIPQLTFRIDDGSISFQQVATVSYSANTWYYVALTYNASNGVTRAYVNGDDIGGTTYTTNITFNSIPYNIAKSEANVYFDGLIASSRTYNRALTETEIKQNFNALRGRYGI